jgi:hypothetical protein
VKTALLTLVLIPFTLSSVQVNAQPSPEVMARAAQCVTRDCYMAVIKGGTAVYQNYQRYSPTVRQNLQNYRRNSDYNPFQPRYNNCLTLANCQNRVFTIGR